MLAPSCLQLGSSWDHVGPRYGSPAALEPTQALPHPFPVASGPPKPPFVPYKTQHRPQKGSQTSNLDFHKPQLGPQKTPTGAQTHKHTRHTPRHPGLGHKHRNTRDTHPARCQGKHTRHTPCKGPRGHRTQARYPEVLFALCTTAELAVAVFKCIA